MLIAFDGYRPVSLVFEERESIGASSNLRVLPPVCFPAALHYLERPVTETSSYRDSNDSINYAHSWLESK
jgi:hypothetical protein